MKSHFFTDKGWNKLLMPINVEEVEELQSEVNVENLFHITIHINKCNHLQGLVSR
jgi:hypothetical protein